jgi:hypothetical protein
MRRTRENQTPQLMRSLTEFFENHPSGSVTLQSHRPFEPHMYGVEDDGSTLNRQTVMAWVRRGWCQMLKLERVVKTDLRAELSLTEEGWDILEAMRG